MIVHDRKIQPKDDLKVVHYDDLSGIIDSVAEIIDIRDTLDHVEQKERLPLLKIIISKLKYDGLIYLSGFDILDFVDSFRHKTVISDNYPTIIKLQTVRSFSTLENMANHLAQMNISIDNSYIDGGYYNISGRRVIHE